MQSHNLSFRFLLLGLGLAIFLSCAQAPSKGFESIKGPSPQGLPVRDKSEIVYQLVDARPAFEREIAPIPGSVGLDWEHFNQGGKLNQDLLSLASHLARVGLVPQQKIKVIGAGAKGKGEETRVALVLKHLGFQNVELDEVTHYRFRHGALPAPPVPSKALFKPEVTGLFVTAEQVKKLIPKKGEQPQFMLFDIRDLQESLRSPLDQSLKGVQFIRAPYSDWLQKINTTDFQSWLTSKGYAEGQMIVVYSGKALTSASLVWQLTERGIKAAVLD